MGGEFREIPLWPMKPYHTSLNLTTGRMPNTCVVPGCTNHSGKPECQGLSFYRLPLDNPELLREWLIKMHLSQKDVSEHSRVCGMHFVGGRKQCRSDIPQLFPWSTKRKSPKTRQPLYLHNLRSTLSLLQEEEQ